MSAKLDYGVRALLELAAAYDSKNPRLVKGDDISRAQHIPVKFLEGILTSLRTAGFVISQRGAEGGYRLSKDPAAIALADVVRALDGPLAAVRSERPEELNYEGAAAHLVEVWIALRAAMREVLEGVTLADVVENRLPAHLKELLDAPDAWQRR